MMKYFNPLAASLRNWQRVKKASLAIPVLMVALISLNSILFLPVKAADNSAQSTATDLVAALQKGGFNLYFRHEATDWFQVDTINNTGDWLSCDPSHMRQLSDAGRKAATATGDAIRSLGIPIARVYASPYCRTVQTAKLMQVGEVEPTTDVMNLRVSEYFHGTLSIVATARSLFSTPPAPGTNTVIVSHGNLARKVIEQSPAEGDVLILRPDGKGGFNFIGRLTASDWLRMSSANPGKVK
jgi:hypothetical protein